MHRKEEKWNKTQRSRMCEWRGVCSVYFIRVCSRIWAMNLRYETLIIFLSDELKWNHRWAPMCITNPTNPLFFRVFLLRFFSFFLFLFSTLFYTLYSFAFLISCTYNNSVPSNYTSLYDELPYLSTQLKCYSVYFYFFIFIWFLLYISYKCAFNSYSSHLAHTKWMYLIVCVCFACARLQFYSFVSIQTWSLYLLAKYKPNIRRSSSLILAHAHVHSIRLHMKFSQLPEHAERVEERAGKPNGRNILYEMDQTNFFLNICVHNDLCAPWELHPALVQEYETGKQASSESGLKRLEKEARICVLLCEKKKTICRKWFGERVCWLAGWAGCFKCKTKNASRIACEFLFVRSVPAAIHIICTLCWKFKWNVAIVENNMIFIAMCVRVYMFVISIGVGHTNNVIASYSREEIGRIRMRHTKPSNFPSFSLSPSVDWAARICFRLLQHYLFLFT